MFKKLEAVEARFNELESKLSDPELAGRPGDFRRFSQEHAGLLEIVTEFRNHKKLQTELAENRELLSESDPEIIALAKEEIKRLDSELKESEARLQILLLPRDPNDAKNVMLEIRAGAGGEEAALFVGELFRMYQRYSERQAWRVEVLSANPTGIGGFKEIIAMIEGNRV